MNANANDTVDSLHRAGKDAAGDFRRRAGNVKDYAGDELRAFISDVEDLVKRVGNVSDADVARARAKVSGALGDVRRLTSDASDSLRERAREAATQADEYVHDRPWTAIGLAAAIGLIIGVGVTAVSSRR
jgi:ElaB protein